MSTPGLNTSITSAPAAVKSPAGMLQITPTAAPAAATPPGTIPGTNPQGALPGQTATLTPKMTPFAPRKEDQSILNQTNSDPKAQAGTFNGVSAAIDGYLRIAKRRYVARGAYNTR